eukprot:TRINITY_DN61614_c0_g1_i1.p1 TRINITY_DN61614_c0_g1~~TRINITY_DN61614_c0_g1_i1.p1  ORF type:complete len:212 (-),score=91.98 TRINITY_DN61614_c0_g1_i1:112-747(-)
MAPKEEVTMKAVLEYLTAANRPYSTNDVFLNLHKEHGKPAVQRVIDLMVTENKLKIKMNGKQSCYFVNQDSFTACSEEELAMLETKCKEAEDLSKTCGDSAKQKEAKLRSLTNSLTDSQAKEEVNRLEEENRQLLDRLSKLENNQELVSAEDKAKISLLHTTTVTLWKKRKRMATDVLDSVLESWPKTKQSLMEEVGVDTDESVGVKIPTS